MKDPTADLIRAFEIRVGDRIVIPQDFEVTVDEINPIGGDEYGPAAWEFVCGKQRDGVYRYTVPYAALVKVKRD